MEESAGGVSEKECSVCHLPKPLDVFGSHKSRCKACETKRKREYERLHPEKVRAIAQRRRERRQQDPAYAAHIRVRNSVQAARRKRNVVGFDRELYLEMLERSGGFCGICGRPETAKVRGKLLSLAIDHDHETGKARGLLCLVQATACTFQPEGRRGGL